MKKGIINFFLKLFLIVLLTVTVFSCKESHELENTVSPNDEFNVPVELAQKIGSAFSDEKNFWKNLSNSTKKEKSARLSFSKKTIKEILIYKK